MGGMINLIAKERPDEITAKMASRQTDAVNNNEVHLVIRTLVTILR